MRWRGAGAGQFHRASAGAIVWQQNDHTAVNYIINAFKQLKLPVQLCDDITAAEYGKRPAETPAPDLTNILPDHLD